MFEKSCSALSVSGSAARTAIGSQYSHPVPAANHTERPQLQHQSWKAGLLRLLAALSLVPVVCAGTTYYAATSGSSGNNGLSEGSPWPLDYALAHCGANSTVIVARGTYTATAYTPSFDNVTVRSSVKWGAKIVGGSSGLASWPAGTGVGTVFDGFEVTGQTGEYSSGVYIVNRNCTVRNCWIHDFEGSGVQSHPVDGTLVENCIIEHGGVSWNQCHGMYISGNDVVLRNNVCRYVSGSGIALGDNSVVPLNMRVYNNLCYNNGTWGLVAGGALNGATLYVYNNTLVGGPYGIGAGTSVNRLYCTNNIIMGNTSAANLWGGGFIQGDYNMMSSADFSQAHGFIVSQAGFVNPSSGLFWLNAGSPATNKALGAICGPVDFFGKTQSTVRDLGAFQYNSAYTADTRVLDPSPTGGANYWQNLGGTNGSGSGSTGGGSSGGGLTNGFTFAASAGVLSAPFVVTNGNVCQQVDTEPAGGGQAVYRFTTTNAGVYVVNAVVNAPNGSQNSFYVTMDGAPPNEAYNVWDVPITTGFQSETVAWRGNGTWDADEFVPKAFALTAGSHFLTFYGREPNTQLQSVQIVPVDLTPPSSAPVLRGVTPGP